MPRARKRLVLVTGAVVFVAVVAAAVVLVWPSAKPAQSAEQADPNAVVDTYLAAFSSGDAKATAALTDDPAAAATQLAAVRKSINPVSLQAVPVSKVQGTSVPIRLVWELRGDHEWTYDTSLSLVHKDSGWLVHWSPTAIHPKLKAGQSIGMRTQSGTPAVLDRAGKPLLTWTTSGPKAVGSKAAPLLLDGMARVATDEGTTAAGAWHVALLDNSGKEVAVLHRGSGGKAVAPLHSTLDRKVQSAAQHAVDSVGKPAALIAIVPSSGDIVAVAENKAADGKPMALHGLYPPGSTFKIVTATAVLTGGTANASTVLPCPGEETVGTRRIRNAGFDLGDVPMHTAFAHSCNTTFAALASELPHGALPDAAATLGLGADFTIPGITTEAGNVRAAANADELAEDGIGQGTVQASPFGMALVCATVDSGKAVTPRLWTNGPKTKVNKGYQPPSGAVLGPVRTMMREVVTAGTATSLRGEGKVYGKTGTAQFGDGSHAHGWFAGYRGDLAFAVLVTDAGTSSVAVSVTGKFLAAAG